MTRGLGEIYSDQVGRVYVYLRFFFSQTDVVDAFIGVSKRRALIMHNEQRCLLPQDDDDNDVGVQLSIRDALLKTASVPKQSETSGRSWMSLRSDVWTLLHYRTSLTERSKLQRASYVLEICVLVLITLNVLLAMYVSASSVRPARTLTN